jgi:hypothetical protein
VINEESKQAMRRVLDQPFIGFAPWILLSVVEGPGRLLLASILACMLAFGVVGAEIVAGLRPKLLDTTAIMFFGAMIAVAAVGGSSTRHWLGLWAGEVSNVAIALITLGSIAARRPFTLAYARETTARTYWDSPLFLRVNYTISTVWAVAFLLIAMVGYIGDGPLHQPNNIWTAWIIQIALVILAMKFTEWYPDHAAAEARADHPAGGTNKPTPLTLLRPLAAYLIPAGVLVMVVSGKSWGIGAALMVLGVLLSRWLQRNAAGVDPSPEGTTQVAQTDRSG